MPSTIYFRGDAGKSTPASSVQITGNDVATTYKLTIGNKVVSVLGQAGGVNATATALQTAAGASSYVEFQELTFTVSTDTITWTAKTPGMYFLVAKSVSGGTGTMGAVTVVTALSSPNDLSVVANYSGGALPSNGDTLIFENLRSGSDIKYNMDALSGIALAKVVIRNCSCQFGLPSVNPSGYFEYRPQYMKLNSAIVEFNCPESQLARIDSEANQVAFTVKATGTSSVPGMKTLLWKGTHASNVCYFDRGSIGVAMLAGETATIATLYCGYVTSPQSDSNVQIGAISSTVTLGAVNRIGGLLDLYCGSSGVIHSKEQASLIRFFGPGTVFKILSYAGKIEYYSAGTITDLTIGESIIFDATANEYGFVITNVAQGYKKCSFLDPFKRATAPAAATWLGIKANGCSSDEITVDRGQDCIILAA